MGRFGTRDNRRDADRRHRSENEQFGNLGGKGYIENKGGGGGTSAPFDPTMEDYIPPEWGKSSRQVRVVEAGAPNNFDIIIKGN